MHKPSTFDIIVVGCGPGGATAGAAAANRGLSVAILEQRTHFGQKLCAGGVPARIWTDFDVASALVECRIRRVDTFDAGSESWSSLPMDWGATVSRTGFDTYLARRAELAGAQLLPGCRCTGLHRESKDTSRLAVHSAGQRFDLRARIVILADGFKSLAAKAIRGLPRYNCTEIVVATQVEVEPAAQALQASDTLAFFFDPQLSPAGYAWCFPKRHGFTLGVGCVLSHAPKGLTIRSLNWMLDGYAPLQQRIGPCQPLGPFRSACIPVRQRTTLCEDGLMLVGDAAGQVSPLWGEGIGYAMRAGQLAGGIAADALANGETSRERLLEYGQTWYEQFGRELQAQRNQLEMRMMVHELPGQRAEGAGRFAEFGPYAEIAAQFSYLVYPIRSREELIAQCGGIGRTFLFRGRVLQLSQGLAQLPDSIYPLESWSDAATKILGWVTARRRS